MPLPSRPLRRASSFTNANVVLDGNSLFAGNHVAAAIGEAFPLSGSGVNPISVAVSGQTWRQMSGLDAGLNGVTSPTVTDVQNAFVVGKENILVLWEDTNAIFGASPRTASQVIQDQIDYIAARKAERPTWKIILLTALPRQDSNKVLQASGNAALDAVRAWQKDNFRAIGVEQLVDTRYPGSPFDLPNYSDAAFTQADAYYNATEVANNTRIHISFEVGRPFIAALVGRAIARLRR